MTEIFTKFYVYRITCSHPNSVCRYYYGSRSCKCEPREDTKYWSSSKLVKQARKLYGPDFFTKKILAVFQTRSEALAYEARIHLRLNVKDHPLFFNQANQTTAAFCYTNWTPEQKTKISTSLKRYYEENPGKRTSISDFLKTRHDSTNKVFGSIRRGAKHSDETKKEISDGLKEYYAKLPPKSRAKKISLGLKNSQKVKQRNKKVVQCPFCLKKGNGPTMYRWHFSNCQFRVTPGESKE
jgi:hypothetical protein